MKSISDFSLLISMFCNVVIGTSNQISNFLRVKRQTVSFAQQQYSFSSTSCTPNALAGQVTGSGVTFYTIASYPSNLGINPQTGQVYLTNYLPTNVPATATIRGYSGTSISNCVTFSTCPSALTTVSVTCTSGVSPNLAPVGVQSSYTFQASSCLPGAYVGKLSVTNPTNVVYASATPNSPLTISSNGLVSYVSQATAGTTQTFSITASNSFGSTTIPVTVRANCVGIGGIGTGSNGAAVSAPTFSQPLSQLMATSCAAGTQIGSISVNNGGSGTVYSILSPAPGFTINAQTGAISLTGNPVLPSNVQQSFIVLATSSAGTGSTTVAVTPSCSNGASTAPTFAQSFYSFPIFNCGTAGTSVGTVSASTSGAVAYSITPPMAALSISNTGAITLTGNPPLTAGLATSFTVAATNSAGTGSTLVSITCTSTTRNTVTSIRGGFGNMIW